MMMLSIPSVVVFGILGVAKLWLGSKGKLNSAALRKDGMCSVAGAILSAAVVLASTLQYSGNEVWWLDAAAAVIVSAALLFVGVKTMIHNIMQGNRFWTIAFWFATPKTEDLSSMMDAGAVDSSKAVGFNNAL